MESQWNCAVQSSSLIYSNGNAKCSLDGEGARGVRAEVYVLSRAATPPSNEEAVLPQLRIGYRSGSSERKV